MKALKQILVWLVYLLPLVLFCAYHPVISLGGNESMNFELSLPLIWLVVFDTLSFVTFIILVKQKKDKARTLKLSKEERRKMQIWGYNFVGISDRHFFLFALFPLYATISIFWSENYLRGVLTSGIIWLLFFAVFSILFILPQLELPKNFSKRIMYVIFGSTIFAGVVCIAQSIADLAGVSREITGMCLGCTTEQFGFPHPNGLAIEPQFMGNLLLAPSLLGLYLIVFTKQKKEKFSLDKIEFSYRERIGLIFTTLFAIFVLFITFSRGAIYAFGVAVIILLLIALWCKWKKREDVRVGNVIMIPLLAFAASIMTQGIWAEFGPTNETFVSATTKAIHQLSLGRIDLRPQTVEEDNCADYDVMNSYDVTNCSEEDASEMRVYNESTQEANFDGYVAESTNIRLELNEIAFATWQQDIKTILFGVGLGGAGVAMYEAYPERIGSSKEIVQNQFFSILLELGVIGVGLVALGLGLAIYLSGRDLKKLRNLDAITFTLILSIAYLLTLNFFAGLPNALHIYLMPALIYMILIRQSSSPVIR